MNGAEHYKKAEQLLANANSPETSALTKHLSVQMQTAVVHGLIAQAQVHATLALAARHTQES